MTNRITKLVLEGVTTPLDIAWKPLYPQRSARKGRSYSFPTSRASKLTATFSPYFVNAWLCGVPEEKWVSTPFLHYSDCEKGADPFFRSLFAVRSLERRVRFLYCFSEIKPRKSEVAAKKKGSAAALWFPKTEHAGTITSAILEPKNSQSVAMKTLNANQ